MPVEHLHFVTGRLAESSLRSVVDQEADRAGFHYSIDTLPISVAALMTPDWIAKRIQPPAATSRIIIPGYCSGDLEPIVQRTNCVVDRGPKDLRQLPAWLGRSSAVVDDYGEHDIQIIAEINHAPDLSPEEILKTAEHFKQSGADIIDVGCNPGEPWLGVKDCVHRLHEQGYRVSIDSLNPTEIELAVRAGAELVLSVNATNRDAASDWGCEVVAIPDTPDDVQSLRETISHLENRGIKFRADPVLEPVGLGFTASLARYIDFRREHPEIEMMMGIGNITELTDVDSGGMNVLLLGICQELGIRSVLTTEVINWACTSVRECDLGRRLVHYAATHRVLPKHLDPQLVTLRDVNTFPHPPEFLDQLSSHIKDNNFRIFAQQDQLHLLSANLHLTGRDPFQLFEELLRHEPANMDPSHAFYLGYEFSKAVTALTLNKKYSQDESLDWGYLTVPEASHRLRRSTARRTKKS